LRRYECVSLGLDRNLLLTEDRITQNKHCILTDLPEASQAPIDLITKLHLDKIALDVDFSCELFRMEMRGDRKIQIPIEKRFVPRFWIEPSTLWPRWHDGMSETAVQAWRWSDRMDFQADYGAEGWRGW
jgi:hypothetical protein